MEDRVNEVVTDSSEIIEVEKEFNVNLHNVYESICKIIYNNNHGSGFLIRLPKDKKELYCLITNEHVIKKEMIDSKKTIDIKYKLMKKSIQIKLDLNERFIKYDPTLDFTIIEVGNLIKQKYFLSPYRDKVKKNDEIYIIQYPGSDILSFSEGKIKKIENNELVYDASTKPGSSGIPILLKGTEEVIGIHKSGSEKRKENYGTLINSIIQCMQAEHLHLHDQKNVILCAYNKQKYEIDLLHDYNNDMRYMSDEEKNALSHRGRALEAVKPHIVRWLTEE